MSPSKTTIVTPLTPWLRHAGEGYVFLVRAFFTHETTRWHNYRLYQEHVEVRTTFSLEIKMDVGDDEQTEAMKACVVEAAKTIFAQAILLAGKRKPQIKVFLENSMIGVEDLSLNMGE